MHSSAQPIGHSTDRPRLFLAIAAALAACFVIIPVAQQPIDALIGGGLFLDDAFFYSVIAERIATGGPPSLDGIHVTNGFQPLWMIILVILNGLIPNAESIQLLASASFACIVLATFVFVYWSLRDRDPAVLPLVLVFLLLLCLLNPRFLHRVMNGLETPLLILMLGLWLVAAGAGLRKNAGPAAIAAFTALSCLLFLTRTDLFWAPFFTTFIILYRYRVSVQSVTNIVVSCGLVLPYLLWNQIHFGAIVPISGRVKRFYLDSQFPTLSEYLASNEWTGLLRMLWDTWGDWRAIPVGLSILAFAMPQIRRNIPAELRLAALICLCHVAYMQLVHRELRPYTSYYFVPEVIVLTLLSIQSLQHFLSPQLRRVEWTAPFAPYAFLVGLAGVAAVTQRDPVQPDPNWMARVEIAETAAAFAPADEPVGAFWPGIFAHLMANPVVPLDGIASSPEYFDDVIRREREFDYAESLGIRYFVAVLPANFAASDPRPVTTDWPMLYLDRMSTTENLRFTEVASVDFSGDGRRWALLRVERM